MTSFRRIFNVSLTLLGLGLLIAVLPGCVSPWGGSASYAAGLTPQQERWWAANAPQAKFVAGKGWQVPGTPGYFDASGRPLASDARAVAAHSQKAASPSAADERNSAGSLWESITGQKPKPASTASSGMGK